MELYTKDNFLEDKHHYKSYLYASNTSARWGEYDDRPDRPSGLTVNIREHEPIYKKFNQVARDSFSCLTEDFECIRMYVNVFFPGECPRWHFDTVPVDGLEAYTVLYYPQHHWERNEGGCTEFWCEDHTYGSLPLPNRAVCFDGTIWHRATPFSENVRYTYAIKYENVTDPELDTRMFGSSRT